MRAILFSFAACLLPLAFSGEAAPVFCLSPTGDDAAPGTREQPMKSLAAGVKRLAPGASLVLLAGTHPIEGQVHISGLNGTEQQPVTIRGEKGARLLGPFRKGEPRKPKDPGAQLLVQSCSWLVFDGLEFGGMARAAFTLGSSSHITIRNCHIHDYSNYAVITWIAKHVLIENCRIHGSADEHGIYLSKDTDDVVVRGCEISDTAINGIHINSNEIERVVVERNVFHHNSRDWGACVTLMGARDVIVRNNLFFCNLGHIFTITSDARDAKILFNTIFQPPGERQGQVLVVRSPLAGFEVKGNVFVTNALAFDTKPEDFTPTSDFNYNLYAPACGKQSAESHSVFGKMPQFVKAPGWQDATCDLHLKAAGPGASGAPLLDKLAPLDFEGKERVEGGPLGAFATFE